MLQCAVAVVNALTDLDHVHRDEVLSAEKVMRIMLQCYKGIEVLR